MSTAVLSIGSNVGDRLGHLQSAVDAMRRWLRAVSPVYETEPWGPVAQDDYLNAVLLVADADAGPADWLDRAQAAEWAAGRTRETRWGPRTLDVDVVAVDDVRSDDPELTLPHPRAAQRAFVLMPWLAVDPEARLGERAVRELLAALPSGGVRARPDLAVA
ncbi:MAG TPA: 2-amino-4-hydroxy-6-hydroxymethyldihydropteridine diphosphokinase [Jatrophihabitantaceae bacterium]|jgi:2-amino-4-hydroxy-6-hydroxymethyldihydropteridine diphosphokinase